MNIFKKIYCRTFQGVLRAALPILPYREPEHLDSIRQLPEVLRSKQINAVLLITDAGIRKCGLTAPLEKILSEK